MLRSHRNFSFNIRPAERTEEIRLGGLDQQDSARHAVLVRPFQKGLVGARFFSWKRRKGRAAAAIKNAHTDCQKESEGSANGRIIGLRFHRLTNFLPEYWGNQGVCRASCARAQSHWNAADCVAVQTSRNQRQSSIHFPFCSSKAEHPDAPFAGPVPVGGSRSPRRWAHGSICQALLSNTEST